MHGMMLMDGGMMTNGIKQDGMNGMKLVASPRERRFRWI